MHTHSFVVVFVLLFTINIALAQTPHWDYSEAGPDTWGDLFSTCNGDAQSPINIVTVCTSFQTYAPFQFSPAYATTQAFRITNSGHSVDARQVDANANPLTLTGGGLTEPFTFDNFHLHWGENFRSGSEHQVNGQKYAGEVHFVHVNAAKTQFTVLAMFMQSTTPLNLGQRRKKKRQTPNTDAATLSEWAKYFPVAQTLVATNSTAVINLQLSALIGNSLSNFYRYQGSLTAPPCTEAVIWSVFQTPIQFVDNQIDALRTSAFDKNFRSPQPVNGRIVFRSFVNATPSTIPDFSFCAANTNLMVTSSGEGSIVLSKKQLLSYFSFCFFFLFLIR